MNRQPSTGQYAGQINEILSVQGVRMDRAAAEEKKRKAALLEARKRPTTTPSESLDPKRVKLESSTPTVPPATALASFDFTSLPASLITNLIVANLDAFTEAQLVSLVTTFCQSRNLNPPPSLSSIGNGSAIAAPPQPALAVEERSTTPPAAPPSVKAEPVDPLQMDIDEGVIDFEPESIEAKVIILPLAWAKVLIVVDRSENQKRRRTKTKFWTLQTSMFGCPNSSFLQPQH